MFTSKGLNIAKVDGGDLILNLFQFLFSLPLCRVEILNAEGKEGKQAFVCNIF